MKKPYLIAEVGVNFYDSAKELNISPMEAAKLYIKEARACGANAVKFQSYKASTIVSKNSPAYWDLKKEPTKTQFELFEKHDGFNEKDYYELYKYAKTVGIDFMSTPFDYDSADYLDKMVDMYKISSSDLSNIPFLQHIAKKGKPIILSTGASYLNEVDRAVQAILKAGCSDLVLLHCVLSYPCKNEDANLNTIKYLKAVYPNLKIGYSDHTMPDENMTILSTAYLLGAEVIEKHFTLNKKLSGNDHYHAGDPTDFYKAVMNFKIINETLGIYGKPVLECEITPRKEARRSLVLKKAMKKGDIIGKDDLIAKRPGYGISPEFLSIVIGRKVQSDLDEDTILTWEMV